jgi:hypothetical protein
MYIRCFGHEGARSEAGVPKFLRCLIHKHKKILSALLTHEAGLCPNFEQKRDFPRVASDKKG